MQWIEKTQKDLANKVPFVTEQQLVMMKFQARWLELFLLTTQKEQQIIENAIYNRTLRDVATNHMRLIKQTGLTVDSVKKTNKTYTKLTMMRDNIEDELGDLKEIQYEEQDTITVPVDTKDTDALQRLMAKYQNTRVEIGKSGVQNMPKTNQTKDETLVKIGSNHMVDDHSTETENIEPPSVLIS